MSEHSVRDQMRQSTAVAKAGNRARVKAILLHQRRGETWTIQRTHALLRILGVSWRTPRTAATLEFHGQARQLAQHAIAAKQEGRLAQIHRAIGSMQAGGYVRPSRLHGKKLGLGE